MRISIKKTEEELRRELFGPIQEAAKQPYQLDVDPRECWCDLSELRFSILLCHFKPVGCNMKFHELAIVDHMCRIYDNENEQSEAFLSDEDKVKFRNQQRQVLMGGCEGDSEKRLTFPPKYMCRPSLNMIREKIQAWYDIKKCEENEELAPEQMEVKQHYVLPDSILVKEGKKDPETKSTKDAKRSKDTPSTSKNREDSGSPVVAPPEKKKKKKRIVEED